MGEISYSDLETAFEQGGTVAVAIGFVIALLLTLAISLALRLITDRLSKMTSRTHGRWDEIFVACLAKTSGWTIFIWIFHPLLLSSVKSENVLRFSKGVVVLLTCLQLIKWGLCAIGRWHQQVVKRKADSQSSFAAIGLLSTVVKVLLVISVVLMGLGNLGVDVGALVAGLGVGGIAVALAAQNVLGDFLASLSIVLDKPFVVGDFIVVGNDLGTVENIGIKTTRVRSLSGEELIFANKDLLESRVRNFKRMWQRRVERKFGISRSTPLEKIRNIPLWVKEIVDRQPKIRIDRIHFGGIGESSWDFELVFWVTDPDFNVYMDIQQKIYFEIIAKFQEEGVLFALPIQALQVQPPAGTPPSVHSQAISPMHS